ncbi:MAG: sigma factor [Burkholderiaceae bacterium]
MAIRSAISCRSDDQYFLFHETSIATTDARGADEPTDVADRAGLLSKRYLGDMPDWGRQTGRSLSETRHSWLTNPLPLELAVHRPAMLRFACRKIRDEGLAEDAVQDALVSAVAAYESFQGQSVVRTWLGFPILNHKIQDIFRCREAGACAFRGSRGGR